jgi:predicted Zn-dependent protease
MRLSLDDVRAIAVRAAKVTPADEAEALVTSSASALTRFAGNRIHQNVAETDTQIQIRAVLGTRTGVATTNRLDDVALVRCASAAVEAARHAPEDPEFPGLPGPAPVTAGSRVSDTTRAFGPEARARAAATIIGHAERRELVAAGAVAVNDTAIAVANSHGVDAAMGLTDVRATVLTMGTTGGSGWASFLGTDAADLSPDALGEEAAETAARAADPQPLEPGVYTVVLAPEAVSDVLDFLGYLGFGAKAFAEGSSFLTGAVGTQLVDPRITIVEDALSAATVGLAFDFEGQPKHRVPLIEAGVAREPVTDSYYAHKLGRENTGHALPSPNPYGPLPLNLEMAAGDASVADMIASVKRGVYVSRFHYVNVEDPMKAVLTGMTRDGTFMIEDGRLARPVRNLRVHAGGARGAQPPGCHRS